jgi:hypothetical protein
MSSEDYLASDTKLFLLDSLTGEGEGMNQKYSRIKTDTLGFYSTVYSAVYPYRYVIPDIPPVWYFQYEPLRLSRRIESILSIQTQRTKLYF